jgi:hypothetical protein
MKRWVFSLTVVIVMLLGGTVTADSLLTPANVIERAIWCLGKEEQDVKRRIIHENGYIHYQTGMWGIEAIQPAFTNNNKNKVVRVTYALLIDDRKTAITGREFWKNWLDIDGWEIVKKGVKNQRDVIIYSKGAYWILQEMEIQTDTGDWMFKCMITTDRSAVM